MLTTSAKKGAHLGTLFSLHGVVLRRWSGFRGYPELQVERASESLRTGAEYLRSRFSRPFLIEDTEVRIEAYSRGTRFSYPGFDLKRWWSVTTFEEIDAKCRQKGTREVRQTSSICLSVPGLPPTVFRGVVRGTIAHDPYRGPERPDAPWLNPGEFGTIFVPDGANLPFAAMPLAESFRYDFRKRAVDQVVARLSELNTILNLEQSCYVVDDELESVVGPQLELFPLDDGGTNGTLGDPH
ncbi:MAG: hypothetical protein IT379_41965 [Deltaproteobacteria bacterium]|nr:hypothetical protein [Deltaproteobacteria bacterium]